MIGLDFGTAFTKCVVRAPTLPGTNAFAIPFGVLGDRSLPFLLPSQVFVGENGTHSLEPRAGAKRIEALKREIVFGGASLSEASQRPIVGFLALVIRLARRWMLTSKAAVLADRPVQWSLNLGLPAATVDQGPLVTLYRRLARAAWYASTVPGPVMAREIPDHRASRVDAIEDLDAIEVVPEVAAEVVGYARSPMRREGLHLLVDAGAGTLDACMFNLHDQGEGDRYSIFTAAVQPLGVETINRSGDRVRSLCERMIAEVLMHTKRRRHPASRDWQGGPRLFMCGGGSLLPYYFECVRAIEKRIAPAGIAPLRRIAMPRPASLDGAVAPAQFHRIAVAWGLSFDAINVGQIDLPSEIDDVKAIAIARENLGGMYEK